MKDKVQFLDKLEAELGGPMLREDLRNARRTWRRRMRR